MYYLLSIKSRFGDGSCFLKGIEGVVDSAPRKTLKINSSRQIDFTNVK